MDKCQSSVYRSGQDPVPSCTLRAKKSPDGVPGPAAPPSGTPGQVRPPPPPSAGQQRRPRDPRGEGGGPFASVPRTETSPGLKGQIRFLPLDSTSLVWKSSEEVVIFSKGIWFRACVIKPESTCFSPRSSIPASFSPPTPIFFLFNCHPSFWTKDRTCLDDRSNLFCAVAPVCAQGILNPTRFLILTGFQSFDQGYFSSL